MGSMDVSFIPFHFNHSFLIHFLVFQLDRKGDKISKRCSESVVLFDHSWKYIHSTRIKLLHVLKAVTFV